MKRSSRREMRRSLLMLGLLSLGIALGVTLLSSWKHLAPISRPRPAALPVEVRNGIRLLGERRCGACHAAEPAWEELLHREPAPDLAEAGTRLLPGGRDAFLQAPHAVRPDTAMPDLLAGLAAPDRAAAGLALSDFLASRIGDAGESVALPEDAVEWGRQLYHQVGCVACHSPFESASSLESPLAEAVPTRGPGRSLAAVAERWTYSGLRAFLADPLAVRPDGVMPDLHLTPPEAEAVAAYLVHASEPGDLPLEPGLAYEYFEEDFVVDVPDFDAFTPVRWGSLDDFSMLPPHREESFGFRYRGTLEVPSPGEYRFFTESDDGSRLWIDGEVVVRNDGFHDLSEAEGTLHLEAGEHALQVTFFEGTGDEGLVVSWQRPEGEKEVLPAQAVRYRGLQFPVAEPRPVVEEARERGREWFERLHCNACHDPEPGAAPASLPLASLSAHLQEGCMAPQPVPGVPWFALTAAQHAELRAVLGVVASGPPSTDPAEHLATRIAELRCTACHTRDGAGGPAPELRPYFTVQGEDDLGDESRFPPTLDHVGAKLVVPWLERVLLEGASLRSDLVTRMPRFGAANVAGLVDLFPAVDLPAFPAAEAPELRDDRIANGCRLAGTRGLGCIQCHRFAEFPSLGMQSVDLTQMGTRLRYPWFRNLLLDPDSLGMTTRMPSYFDRGKSALRDVEDGDAERQVQALWSYLSLGSAMPLPEGLVPLEEEYQVAVTSQPVCVSVFLRDASPRSLMVGLPERIHYAYDVENGRLVSAWRGRFFNAEGTWHGRAGQLEEAPEADRADLPAGPTFQRLASLEEPWGSTLGRAAGLRVRGREYDSARRPVFLYRWEDLDVEDHLEPYRHEGEVGLRRRLVFHAPGAEDGVWFRVAVGPELRVEEHDGSGSARDGVRCWSWEGLEAAVRRTAEGDECLLPVIFAPAAQGHGFAAEVAVSFTWNHEGDG